MLLCRGEYELYSISSCGVMIAAEHDECEMAKWRNGSSYHIDTTNPTPPPLHHMCCVYISTSHLLTHSSHTSIITHQSIAANRRNAWSSWTCQPGHASFHRLLWSMHQPSEHHPHIHHSPICCMMVTCSWCCLPFTRSCHHACFTPSIATFPPLCLHHHPSWISGHHTHSSTTCAVYG